MEPISDDELQRLRKAVSAACECGRLYAAFHVQTLESVLARLDSAESRAADVEPMRQRIERLEAKLDAWHDLYGTEDWRAVLAAEMEGDHE